MKRTVISEASTPWTISLQDGWAASPVRIDHPFNDRPTAPKGWSRLWPCTKGSSAGILLITREPEGRRYALHIGQQPLLPLDADRLENSFLQGILILPPSSQLARVYASRILTLPTELRDIAVERLGSAKLHGAYHSTSELMTAVKSFIAANDDSSLKSRAVSLLAHRIRVADPHTRPALYAEHQSRLPSSWIEEAKRMAFTRAVPTRSTAGYADISFDFN
ncbi:hypothetical protein [Pseudomonas aeruginosa]|uniref:hypothetical protein n=1 Tax=Pseudomonas aeruginosa TaxID=287 RepID=UPI00070FEACB|nr:hypothetical protein [Pseudomonas aeruginosa]MDG4417353.1 hypothetical protein [Pseudomonas aeruginosa]RPS13271.1 hypothetical protein IPC1015_33375 [Pseudomonas aeruginosa]RUF51718.1 hypothetical protein IPC1130_30975 [Pseudomonas aeruginosa]HBP1235361.1 hypothetical protein [Pseudomonas aeruginosa]HCF9151015.1 hypothetical protein [Pseudomonas aeruginosa]